MQLCKWFNRSSGLGLQRFSVSCLYILLLVPCTYGIGRDWSSLGPEGGEVTALATDLQNPTIVYAGTFSGRIFKSTDAGNSWFASDKGLRVENLPFSLSVTSLAIAPSNSRTIYAGNYYGVFRSMDAGATWSPILRYYVVMAVTVDPADPAVIYAGTYANGVFKSTNGGGAWESINAGLPSTNISSLAIDPQNSNIMYAATQGESGGIYKSTDAGTNWSSTGLHADMKSIAIDPINPSILYALMNGYSTSGYGIYKSTDDGANWIELGIKSQGLGPRGSAALAIDPKIDSILYAGTYSGSYRSSDGGATWIILAPTLNFRCFGISAHDTSTIYAGTTKGIFKNTGSGVTWIASNTGLTAQSINALAPHPQDPATLFASTNSEILKTTNGGANWRSISPIGSIGANLLVHDPRNPDIIYAGYGFSTLFKSTNGGIFWTSLSLLSSANCLAIDPINSETLYAGTYDKGVIKSTNGGSSWSMSNSGYPASPVYFLGVDPQNPATVYAGTLNDGVYKSTDGGDHWAIAGSGLPSAPVYALAIDPQNPSKIYAGTSGYGLFKSTNGGSSWHSSGSGLGVIAIQALAINPRNPATLFAGSSDQGIFRSTDGGDHWANSNEGLRTTLIDALAIDSAGQKIYAGTPEGVWVNSAIGASMDFTMNMGGAATVSTLGGRSLRTGYASASLNSGVAPYGTAVFSIKQNGVTVSEAAVPSSPPTARARILVDYRAAASAIPGRSNAGTLETNTGVAIVNHGSATANVSYTLRDFNGNSLTVGHGIIEAGHHLACFIDSLKNVAAPDFDLPVNFQNAIQFGSLEIEGDQPLSVIALRGVINQRDEFLVTTTPVADLSQPLRSSSVSFPHFVDGGGYSTSLILMNTSLATEIGSFQIMDKDGNALTVRQSGGIYGSTFNYSIPAGGLLFFQTDGSPTAANVGWVRLRPDYGTPSPIGSGVFSYNPQSVLVSESGISSAEATTHARIYVDLSANHDTGLAIANTNYAAVAIMIRAYKSDGTTAVGESQEPLSLPANGHSAAFADHFVTGLPEGFTGVLDITSTTPFAALTLRSLMNERDEFLMTTFPVADANRPAPRPIVFPHIADGGGYTTEFILLSPGAGASIILSLYDEAGQPLDF